MGACQFGRGPGVEGLIPPCEREAERKFRAEGMQSDFVFLQTEYCAEHAGQMAGSSSTDVRVVVEPLVLPTFYSAEVGAAARGAYRDSRGLRP